MPDWTGGDLVPDPDPVPAGALALLEQPGVEDLLQRFLNRRKASTVEAYRKDLTHFAGWLGLPLREAMARLLACDQGQANRLLDHYAGHMRSTSPASVTNTTAAHHGPRPRCARSASRCTKVKAC